MIGYVTLGSSDIPRAAKFYDELLALLGASRFMESDNFVAWSTGPTMIGKLLEDPDFADVPGNLGDYAVRWQTRHRR